MTLGEIAFLLDVDPKWVQNAAASLGGSLPYTLATARRLALVRALTEPFAIPIPRAWALSAELLNEYRRAPHDNVVIAANSGDTAALTVDVHRVLATVTTGLSRLRTMYEPRRRGRPARERRGALDRATDYGLNVGLLASNLRRTPLERLRQLDAMIDFRRRVRRVASVDDTSASAARGAPRNRRARSGR